LPIAKNKTYTFVHYIKPARDYNGDFRPPRKRRIGDWGIEGRVAKEYGGEKDGFLAKALRREGKEGG
jgi:hypothetical protein